MPNFDLLRVLEAKPVGPGVLWLRFSDRSEGTVDLRDQLPPALRAHARRMPEISRLFGIVIHMLYNGHAPPHFHAAYGEFEISIEVDGDGLKGSMPRKGLAMLLEWRDEHRDELLANWRRMRDGEPPLPIPPLEQPVAYPSRRATTNCKSHRLSGPLLTTS